MTTDERLDRLTERLDAMAMNLELMQRQYEERFAKIDDALDQVTHTFAVALDSLRRLDNVVVAHENRLDQLEESGDPIPAGSPHLHSAPGGGPLPEHPGDRRLT